MCSSLLRSQLAQCAQPAVSHSALFWPWAPEMLYPLSGLLIMLLHHSLERGRVTLSYGLDWLYL